MAIQLAQVEEFFFRAILQGYVAGVKPTQAANMPGFKEIEFRHDVWCCLDRYCVTHLSNKSAGSTTIWYHDTPVWVMYYNGRYEQEAIEFLRLALRSNYKEKIFLGCRGPASFLHPGNTLLYLNILLPESQGFGNFRGRETIKDNHNGHILGYHEYSGMSLL